MHGSNASVSAPGNPASASPAKRHSSRPKSASGSTIKRAASLTSPGDSARNSVLPMGSQSPSDLSLIALRVGGGTTRRRRSSAVEPFDYPAGEGLGNLNRWSQSTDASAHSPVARRKRASSSAALPGLHAQQMSPSRASRQLIDHSPRSSPHRKAASGPVRQYGQYGQYESPARGRRQVSNPINSTIPSKALPTPYTSRPHLNAEDVDSPSTLYATTPSTSGLATPSTHSSYANDYFGGDGSPGMGANGEKLSAGRNATAPGPPLNYSRMPRPEELQESAHRRRQSEMFSGADGDMRSGTVMSTSHGAGDQRPRTRERREKDKKAMLSKALQKANTAVLLDNAQNFEAALEAYSDACRLLQQVMDRSSGAEDKRKLDAIKVTYTTRIEELQELEESRPSARLEKGLPTRPMSDDGSVISPRMSTASPVEELSELTEEPTVIETARMTRIVDVPQLTYPLASNRDSFFSRTLADVERAGQTSDEQSRSPYKASTNLHDAIREDEEPESSTAAQLSLPDNPRNTYMPAPLLPRKQSSPTLESAKDQSWGLLDQEATQHADDNSRDRTDSNASVSWLDTIDESGSSDTSSVHSHSSNNGLHRKHIRNTSGETNPDFDAAFDAAVEAAYNEGLEPDFDGNTRRETIHADTHSVSTFDENVSPMDVRHAKTGLEDVDDEEEERILNEFTQDYGHGFKFDLDSKSALPRQSDSSGYSRSTWQSSQVSDRNTAGSSLSTVPEDLLNAGFSGKHASIVSSVNTVRADGPPPGPPPTSALPAPPSPNDKRNSATVRARRLSGQNAKQLRIETSAVQPAGRKRASTFHHSPGVPMTDEEQRNRIFGSDVLIGAPLEPSTSDPEHEQVLRSPPSIDLTLHMPSDVSVSRAGSVRVNNSLDHPSELRPIKSNPFRRNKSSISLKDHQTSLSLRDDSDHTVSTPRSATLRTKRSLEPLTSQRTNFPVPGAQPIDGYVNGSYLFDTALAVSHAPASPRSQTETSQPAGLESCPESSLLRPFWLMRAIGSTITHPRGGFVTSRLFVPRDVWQTRGVKLKSLDEKVANCDLLTAALGRIAGVDTYDADAVMEELQGFEEVMERVQATLTKKLGSDVGVHGAMSMFRDATTTSGTGNASTASSDAASGITDKAAKSNSGKSYLSSWRKLRSKSSGTPLSSLNNSSKINVGASAVGDKGEPYTMASVPMTNFIPVERRGQKAAPNLKAMNFEGPQKEYMGSLARLVQGISILGKSLFLITLHLQFFIIAKLAYVPTVQCHWLACNSSGTDFHFGLAAGPIPRRHFL